MAMMDNTAFLISHIRNSFITSDDTGMCELIIDNEDTDRRERSLGSGFMDGSFSDSGREMSDQELSHSYDILPDMDYGAHRRRSNTAQRLDRLKKEKRNQVKIKNISWKKAPVEFTAEDKGYLFEKKTLPPQGLETKSEKKSSFLTHLMETSAQMGDNPFLEYAKYDGRASVSLTKRIDIFLTMQSLDERNYPMPIVVLATARIQDLVGLICWQYINENREPPLSENIESYCLHIAEDDGEVDMDFPSLDKREPVSKFGFARLALVEKEPPSSSKKSSLVVTVTVPNRGFNKFQVESTTIAMKEILQKVLKRRKVKLRPGLNYNLEKQDEPGVAIDLDSTLAAMDTMEFCLVREHSTRGDVDEEGIGDSAIAESLTSHQYKSFIVEMVHRLRTNTEVQLGVSGEKVEIDPVATKGIERLFKQRAVTYDADSIASCDIVEEKSAGRALFRLTYLHGHDYKHHDFEAEGDTAVEIVQKINNILELRLSPARKDFVAARERKRERKSQRESVKFS